MRNLHTCLCIAFMALMSAVPSWSQTDVRAGGETFKKFRKEERTGNRQFGKSDWANADISYRKALVLDSLSVAGRYNLANNQYRQEDMENAAKTMKSIEKSVDGTEYAADYYYNVGDIAIVSKDWKGAVDAFRQSLLLRPDDLEAKENYIYARKMLENQENNQNQDNQNQDNQGDGGDDNNDGNDNQDQNGDGNQNQDQNNQNDDSQNQDRDKNDDGNGNENNPSQGPQQQDGRGNSKISPQQAQQMLNAIQAKEKETSDKVNKEKAAALKARQKDKNW